MEAKLHQQLVTYRSVLGGFTEYQELRTPPLNIPSYDEKYRSPSRRHRSDPRSDGNSQYLSGAAGAAAGPADNNAEDEDKKVIDSRGSYCFPAWSASPRALEDLGVSFL